MTDPLVVRRVRGDEWQALRDLRLSALAGAPQAFGTTLDSAQKRTEADWRETAARSEHTDDWVTFVADDRGSLVGMVSGTVGDDGVPELIQMWVEPRARRAGVGRRLGQAVLDWAARRGGGVVRLAVNANEEAPVALYRSLGFVDTGRQEADLFEGREGLAMVMEAPLVGASR